MKLRHVLIAVVAIELAVGTWLVGGRLLAARVPLPDFAGLDPFAADDLRQQAGFCASADDWRAMGEAYMALGFFREAEACHRIASVQAPRSSRLAYEWAFALERLGELDEANSKYELAATLGDEHPTECFYFIGRNLLRQEKVPEGTRAFERANDLPAARYARAKLLLSTGDLDAAEKLTQPLVAAAPTAMQPYWLKQRIGSLRGDAKQAWTWRDSWEQSIQRLENPFDRDVLRLTARKKSLGLTRRIAAAEKLLTEEKFAEADKQFESVLAARWNGNAADERAEALFRLGQKEESLALLLQVLSRDGPSVGTLERLGDTYSELGREDEARQTWKRAIRLGPGTTARDACFKLAHSYEKAGDKEAGQEWLAIGLCSLGIDLFRERKVAQARSTFNKSLEVDPHSARAWFHLGELERLMGNTGEARKAYDRCLTADPNHGRCLEAVENLREG